MASPPSLEDLASSPEDAASDCDIPLIPISETDDLCNIQYSREETIAAFKSYYEFLTKMYLDADVVVQPPEGGWPEITVNNMRDLGKTDEVVELLRRLPYPRLGKECETAGASRFVNWESLARQLARDQHPLSPEQTNSYLCTTEGMYHTIPSHVVGMDCAQDSRIFLDTHLGVIYFVGDLFTPRAVEYDHCPYKAVTDWPSLYAPKDEEEWRGPTSRGHAWAIPEFFKMLEWHFCELNYVPVSRERVHEAFEEDPDLEIESGRSALYREVRNTFRGHGWPNLALYRKEECMEIVERKHRKYEDSFL